MGSSPVSRSSPSSSANRRPAGKFANIVASILIVWGYVYDGLQQAVSGVADFITNLPNMVSEAGTQIDSTQTMLGWVGIPWGKVSLGVALTMLGVVVWRHTHDKHKLEQVQSSGDAK